MRSIYLSKNTINDYQQGVIINNCIAEGYLNCEVHGIIITPRCDIDNSKVKTLHYLPIIRFEDWISIDYKNLLKEQIQKEIFEKANGILSKHNKSLKMMELFDSSILLEKADDIIPIQKDKLKFKELLQDRILLERQDSSIDVYVKYCDSVGKTILKELKENRRKEYYLIEDWQEKNKYVIILLREIKRIDTEIAKKYSIGFLKSSVNDNVFAQNDILKKDDDENFYHTVAKMGSPYIEHLVQCFFQNFGRIGVENFDECIHSDLSSETIKTILK